jgi:outer membrane protein assembly factor BamB
VIALDGETGEEIWYQKRLTDGLMENKHSYASPIIYRDSEHAFLVTHGADFVIGHSLEDGQELWRCGGINRKENYNPFLRFVASPSYADGLIVVPTAKRGPILALRPTLSGDVTEKSDAFCWRIPSGTPDVASPLIYDGLVYLADEKGVLSCVDAATGKIHYQDNEFSLASIAQRRWPPMARCLSRGGTERSTL